MVKILDFPVTEPQEQFVFTESRNPAIIGGFGSGKTQGGIQRAAYLLMRYCTKESIIGYYMPTYDLIKLRAMPGFQAWCAHNGLKYTTNKSNYSIRIRGLGEIIFRSYDNPDRIIAYETAHAIVDEIDTLPRDEAAEVWRKIAERNRAATTHPAGNTAANVSTPDQGYSGFTYARWGKEPRPGFELVRAPTYSNTALPDLEGYIASIRENYDPIMAEMYIEGHFVSLSRNRVYHFFDRQKHHTSRRLTDADRFLHVSVDFNIGGCVSTINIIENNRPVTVKELVSYDTRDFCHNLAKLAGKTRTIVVYPDATGIRETTNASASDIGIIRQAGFRIDAPRANPFVRDRINSVNGLYSHDRASINTNECPQLTDALEAHGYDEKGKPEKFDQHPSIDDWTESYGYFLHRKFPVVKPVVVTDIVYQ